MELAPLLALLLQQTQPLELLVPPLRAVTRCAAASQLQCHSPTWQFDHAAPEHALQLSQCAMSADSSPLPPLPAVAPSPLAAPVTVASALAAPAACADSAWVFGAVVLAVPHAVAFASLPLVPRSLAPLACLGAAAARSTRRLCRQLMQLHQNHQSLQPWVQTQWEAAAWRCHAPSALVHPPHYC